MWWLAIAALVALRLPHFFGPLDDPNSWRQCDTVHNALDFYRRGFDLLHPAVPWLGAHRTLGLDFPITPALSALLYHITGPSLVWDRLVSMAFFLISAWHLHGASRFVAGTRVARLATLAYLAFPLSVFYSRAPHIEFTVVCGVNGLLHHGLRAIEERGWRQPALAALWATLAALVKAPYLATVLPALALALWSARAIWPWVRLGLAMVPALAAFVWWRHHVDAINARVPDWTFLPDFYKEVNPLWRYVGTLSERLEARNWIRIGRRLFVEIMAYGGVVLAAFAPFNRRSRAEHLGEAAGTPGRIPLDPRAFALMWAAGCAFHILFFFRLNYIHNYYQTPVLPAAAFWVALGTDWLWQKLPRVGPVPAAGVAFAAFLLVAAWLPSTLGYYRVDWLREEAGKVITARVPAGDLLVTSDHNTLPPTDPRLLFRADREGWCLRWNEITPSRILKLRDLGAEWVAILISPENPRMQVPAFLEPARVATDTIAHAGRPIGTLHLFQLARLGRNLSDADAPPVPHEDSSPIWQHPPPKGNR